MTARAKAFWVHYRVDFYAMVLALFMLLGTAGLCALTGWDRTLTLLGWCLFVACKAYVKSEAWKP